MLENDTEKYTELFATISFMSLVCVENTAYPQRAETTQLAGTQLDLGHKRVVN